MGQFPPYTCLMSVYEKENPSFLDISIKSILDQTIVPDEFLVIKDGELGSELNEVLNSYADDYPGLFRFVSFETNRGLWKALGVGVEECANELILRMDSDDYSEPDRAETQLNYMVNNPNCCCCGTLVVEFENDINDSVSLVALPEEHSDILAFSKRRNPFRHPTMLYRKSVVLSVGGYQEMPFFEDYDLVLRLLKSGQTMHNIQKPLVRMRVNPGFYARRGNKDYLGYMRHFRRVCLARGDISKLQYYSTLLPHALVCLMPNSLRECVYKTLLRKKVDEGE